MNDLKEIKYNDYGVITLFKNEVDAVFANKFDDQILILSLFTA